ncbi:4-hydroxy-tetrahydrodipicolinate synthase [Helicobacter sp. MIT 05-5293]|uniref:4-hydroxy-tetrahydrodipicolinate synthase n=1 Tax=Helicobacter sp. MIT 05-5293 TaxID=1548149 RepID=UPI00051DAB31|nr:4-hydroxy-tetrahydrodipicolinate synthase [Helicobacter sp. MIT 05-5293]TLD81970.1 4-hydroxy-tetrahydrodipicolinate synthase [Helicobacter sp. MIT 05-5293]
MVLGAMSALITPFKNQEVDFETYEMLIKRQIKYGMDACVPVGTTGESATLTHKEHMECIQVAVEVCKGSQMKVLAGAGSNSTQEAIELARFAQKCGADALLCVTPYYNKPSQEGLYQHFKAVADSVEIPVMLYNVPSRTGVNIDIQTIKRLKKDVKNIYAIKEATGAMDRVVALGSEVSDLAILSGDDAINYPILANNGKGVISVTGNLFPQEIAQLTHSAIQGDMYQSYEINTKLYEINQILFCESNPIPIKASMFLSGLLKNLEYRLPLVPPSKENMAKIQKILEKYEVRL